MKKVFLAHRFDFLEPHEVDEKTNSFKELLADLNVELISLSGKLLEERGREPDKAMVHEIVETDLAELRGSDILLMDMSIETWNYIGVTCEMVYAHMWHKPIIAYVGDTRNGERLWLKYHADEICSTVDQVKKALGIMINRSERSE
jgi:nucleoside 2-deoxyribosyltransferase